MSRSQISGKEIAMSQPAIPQNLGRISSAGGAMHYAAVVIFNYVQCTCISRYIAV